MVTKPVAKVGAEAAVATATEGSDDEWGPPLFPVPETASKVSRPLTSYPMKATGSTSNSQADQGKEEGPSSAQPCTTLPNKGSLLTALEVWVTQVFWSFRGVQAAVARELGKRRHEAPGLDPTLVLTPCFGSFGAF